jgi:hypothetical protein
MFTADNRVPELLSYIKKNNPNMNQDMAPDVMSTQLNSGSQEYIDWIKQQTKDEQEESSNLQLESKIRLHNHHRHHHLRQRSSSLI